MKEIFLGGSTLRVPAVVVGCMRIGELDDRALGGLIHTAPDLRIGTEACWTIAG